MSEEENEKDFIKVCFNIVAGLEVKNESQAIAKEAILDEVENLTTENKQLKEVIEEVRKYVKNTYDDVVTAFTEDKPMTNFNARKEILQILDKVKGE